MAVAWAYPDGHGHKVNHNDQGGGHKYEFHGHGHEGGHKATSYHKIERHDSKDHPIHFKVKFHQFFYEKNIFILFF